MRILILLGLIYLGYRALKSWMLQSSSSSDAVGHSGTKEIDDVMVKDPVCDVYFARKKGVHLRVEGEDLYFCSTECRDKFMASKSK